MKQKELFNIMHKYGKLLSCNSEKPSSIDVLFAEEIINKFIEFDNSINNLQFKLNDYKNRYFKLKSKLDKQEDAK